MGDKRELTKAINLIMRESVTKKFKNRKEWIRDVKKQLGEFDNLYYRAKILEKFDNKKSAIEIINQMRKLSKIEEKIDRLETEQEKTEVIMKVSDNKAKYYLLGKIKESNNRKKIIDSFTSEIDPDIKPYRDLVVEMIKEFVYDTMGSEIDIQKQEKLEIVVNKTNINFRKDLVDTTVGQTNHLEQLIKINENVRNDSIRLIEVLIHEYGHSFSMVDTFHTYYQPATINEEGMQDLFVELVINHYIEKHKNIQINGKKIKIPYPFLPVSSYEFETSEVRTMLYHLSKKPNEAEKVVLEYEFGDKNKFWEQIYGQKFAQTFKKDAFGNPYIDFFIDKIYEQYKGEDIKIDKNSIYCRRNELIYAFKLQKRLEKDGIKVWGEEKYPCNKIGKIYFKGRKVYQISKEEMQEFCEIYRMQNEEVITLFDSFTNDLALDLSEKEIKQNSFEILNTSSAVFEVTKQPSKGIVFLWKDAFQEEINKARNGQDFSISIEKYKKLIPVFLGNLKEEKKTEYLYHIVQDLQFEYIEQMERLLESGKQEEVMQTLRDEKTGELFLDKRIQEVLERFCINIRYTIEYMSEDIVKSAKRGKIKLDDVSRAKFMLEPEEPNISREFKENNRE